MRPADSPASAIDGRSPLVLGLSTLTLVVIGDRLWSTRHLAEEWQPALTAPYLARSALLAIGSTLTIIGARAMATSRLRPAPLQDRATGHAIAAAVGLTTAAGAAITLLADPVALNDLVSEDRIVEWASAGLSFLAAGLCGAAGIRRYRQPELTGKMPLVAGAFVAGGMFLLLGLEEVSWFQRVLEVESPELFVNRNGQAETNLHNMATTATGNIYFVCAFLLCVAGPFLFGDRLLPHRWQWAQPLVPAPIVLYGSVMAGAVVYLMWNVLWIQALTWMSLVAVLAIGPDHRSRTIGRLVAAAMVVILAVFLLDGDDMVRTWDDTEVRELIVPYGLVLYGAGMWQAVGRLRPEGPDRPDAHHS